MNRVVAWFSCGAASAVAAKMMLRKYGDRCVVAYCDTSSGEHSDNKRFLLDCEQWFGVEVVKLSQDEYDNHQNVAERTRYIRGNHGARCTIELKKKLRFAFQKHDDIHVFGYTSEEVSRANRLSENSPELDLEFPLIESSISKQDTIAIINRAGIEIPRMYQLGYNNNNCIGCWKAEGAGYWNKIRADFPETFQRAAEISRDLNFAVVRMTVDGKRQYIHLDELDPKAGNHKNEPSISCSMLCEIAYSEMEDK